MDVGPVSTAEKDSRPRDRRAGRWLLVLLLFALAAIAFRVSRIDGLLRPIHVSGPSMSPTLWGPYRFTHCPECGITYRVHASAGPVSPTPRCFGCGRLGIEISEKIDAGDRVLVDRAAYIRRSPQRDDLVAIQNDEGTLQVKRVVGMPGEVLRIRDGKLIVDGKPLHMLPEQSWHRSVMVYDDNHCGPAGSRWQRSGEGQWWVYHHLDIYAPADSLTSGRTDCVRDDDPANISLSRATFPVDDLQLSLRIRAATPCTLQLLFAAGERPLAASLELAAGQSRIRVTTIGDSLWQLRQGRPPRRIGPADRGASGAPTAERAPRPSLDSTRPVAFRVLGSSSPQVDRLWLGRSVRYDPPRQFADRWSRGVHVAAGRYLVIGDNPPASADSRSAPEGIARDRIVGRVIRWPSISL